MSRTNLKLTITAIASALLLALAVGACRHGSNEKAPAPTKEQVQEVEKAAPTTPAPEVKAPATADPGADPAADPEKKADDKEGKAGDEKPAPKPAEPSGGEAE